MIRFQNLTKTYPPNIVALKDVTFEVKPEEFVCVVGRSGAGKTTLLRLLLGVEKPTAGKIFFEDRETSGLNSACLSELRRKIGVVFQDYKLIPSKTLSENIAYVMEVMGKNDGEIKKELPRILELVELANRVNHFPVQLSGGEQQRAAIARAICHRPQVILADEPTGNLDPYCTQDIMRLFRKIHRMGTTVILATHDKETIDSLKERVITLDEGRVIRDEKEGRFIL